MKGAPPPPPEVQFAMSVDAVIFVFSLEDEISFQTVYYSGMANYQNMSEIPLVLVGTQDAISSTNPRVIDDARVRKCSNDLKWCTYYVDVCYVWAECGEGLPGGCPEDCCHKEEAAAAHRTLQVAAQFSKPFHHLFCTGVHHAHQLDK